MILAAAGAGIFFWIARAVIRRHGPRFAFSGNIELTQVDIAFKTPGQLMERTVTEGDAVKKGQVIARLDDRRPRARKRAAGGSGSPREAQLAQAVDGRDWQRSDAGRRHRRCSDAEVQQAQAVLDQMLAGSRPQEIQQAEAAVADARTQHEQARRDWERAQTLYKNDDISTAQYDQAQSRFNSTAAI